MRDFLHSPRGGLYGCQHTVSQFNPVPVTRISNLLLAGQSIIAPGLMGAMISAFLACGFLLGDSVCKEAACS
jgi:all-trans-retinol 13,14-reductase